MLALGMNAEGGATGEKPVTVLRPPSEGGWHRGGGHLILLLFFLCTASHATLNEGSDQVGIELAACSANQFSNRLFMSERGAVRTSRRHRIVRIRYAQMSASCGMSGAFVSRG